MVKGRWNIIDVEYGGRMELLPRSWRREGHGFFLSASWKECSCGLAVALTLVIGMEGQPRVQPVAP